jgi:hypothetical protein
MGAGQTAAELWLELALAAKKAAPIWETAFIVLNQL